MKTVDNVVDFLGDLFGTSKFSKVKECYAANVNFMLTRSVYNQAQKEFFEFYNQHEEAERKVANYLMPGSNVKVEQLIDNTREWAGIRIRMEHLAFKIANPGIFNLDL